MFIQGIGLAPVSVPLYTVYLRCGLVTGPVVVGARPSFPVQGISLLLGNDLAGSKVIPDLAVDNKPKLTKDVDKLDSLIPGMCSHQSRSKTSSLKIQPQYAVRAV